MIEQEFRVIIIWILSNLLIFQKKVFFNFKKIYKLQNSNTNKTYKMKIKKLKKNSS